MSEFVGLAVGQAYPGQMIEGFMLDVFAPGGTLLRVGMTNITPSESKAYRKGAIQFGLLMQGTGLLTVWKFGEQPWCDAPFNALAAQQMGMLALPDFKTPLSRLVVQLHLVDTATGLVRGLREFTLSPEASRALAEAIHHQLAHPHIDPNQGIQTLLQYETSVLVKRAKRWRCS